MEIEKIREERKPSDLKINYRIPSDDLFNARKISFHRGSSPVKRRWRLMAWSLAAGVIDLLMMFSLSCVAIGAMVFLMRWQVSLNQFSHTYSLKISLAATWLGFYACYLLLLRVFLGCTLGEWACGLRLGEPRHRLSPGYSLKVHFRLFVTMATGVITLPLLSMIFGVDLAGKLSGLPLVAYGTK